MNIGTNLVPGEAILPYIGGAGGELQLDARTLEQKLGRSRYRRTVAPRPALMVAEPKPLCDIPDD